MAKVCELTGKKTRYGGNRKHRRGSSGAGGVWRYKSQRTSRTWKPNLRTVKLVKNGVIETKKIAMSTYKKLRQGKAIEGYTLAPVKFSSAS